MRIRFFLTLLFASLLISGCATPRFNLFSDASDPLREYTLEGTKKGKVAVIHIRGIILDAPRKGLLREKPSMVQEIVSQLKLAEKDKEVKAIILKVDSPGGSTTASDMLYHEILSFKKRTQKKVVVVLMNVAASGGYYISLPADFILSHPTTITGSIGVIFMRPKLTGFMEKIGITVEINKSGKNKDMGSPFRPTTLEEQKIIQDLTAQLGKRFVSLVAKHRPIDQKALTDIASARVYIAREALQMKLVDKIGYLSDAVTQAKQLAGLSKDCKVVVYRRTKYPDDNIYNTLTTQYDSHRGLSLIDLGLPDSITPLGTGFYYLWQHG